MLVADLGSSRISCGAFRLGRDRSLVLEHVFLDALQGDLSLESLWRESVARSLTKISSDRSFRGQLSVALPGHVALTKFIKIPALDRSKRGKVIEFEAAQAIPYPLGEVVWDHRIMAEDRTNLEIVLTAVKADLMLGLCAAVGSTGYSMAQATPSCVALFDAFRYSYPEIHDSTLIVDVGARSIQLLLVESDRFVARTLPFGGNSVSQSIADQLGTEFAASEKLKLEFFAGRQPELAPGSPLEPVVIQSVETFCTKLRAEVVRSLINLRRQLSASHPTSAYVTGAGAQLGRIGEMLHDELNVPVHRFEPLRRVEVSPQCRIEAAKSSAMLVQMVGLAARLASKKRFTLNLLPPVIRDELAFQRRQPALIAAAALLVMALIPPFLHFHSKAVAAQNRTTGMEAELRPLRDIHERTTELQQKIDQVRNAISDWQDVADRKTTWLRFLADLQTRLVAIEDVWLESLSIVRPTAGKTEAERISAQPATELRLVLSGRLLDQSNPLSKVSPESYERVKRLITSFSESEFVAAIEHERFDNSEPGLLRFDFTLVVQSPKTL
jgi:type IV pilus assembly protein PilM